MNPVEITTEHEYDDAMDEIEELWECDPGTPEEDRLIFLLDAVHVYEEDTFKNPDPRTWRETVYDVVATLLAFAFFAGCTAAIYKLLK